MRDFKNFRLYSFVAGGYLSPMQVGLQTAHAVGNLAARYGTDEKREDLWFGTWAAADKVIIICDAFNSAGVEAAYAELNRLGGAVGLPYAVFHEDQESLNGAATATAVVVPQCYWDCKPVKNDEGIVWAWEYIDTDFNVTVYPLTHPEGQFVQFLKGYRLYGR